jgi:hypothetical protein
MNDMFLIPFLLHFPSQTSATRREFSQFYLPILGIKKFQHKHHPQYLLAPIAIQGNH